MGGAAITKTALTGGQLSSTSFRGASFLGAQLLEPVTRTIPEPQPAGTVYVDPCYPVRPNRTCAKDYTPFWGPLGTWKHQPIDKKLFSGKLKSITCAESNRLPCLPVDSFDGDDGGGVENFVREVISCFSDYWFGASKEKPKSPLTEEELEWSPDTWSPIDKPLPPSTAYSEVAVPAGPYSADWGNPVRAIHPVCPVLRPPTSKYRPEVFRKLSWEQRCRGLSEHQWQVKWLKSWSDYNSAGAKYPWKWDRFQRYMDAGKFNGATTSSLVARSIRYFGPEETEPTYNTLWERRIDPGVDLHDLMMAAARSYDRPNISKPDDVILKNKSAIESEIQAGAERIRKLREEYDAADRLRRFQEGLREFRKNHQGVSQIRLSDSAVWTVSDDLPVIKQETKPKYVSPRPAWQLGGDKYHKPNYCTFKDDGYTGNKTEKELSDLEKFPFIRAAKPSQQEQRKWDKKVGITAEIRGIKRKRADDVEAFGSESEEFETYNSFFDDDEEAAGRPEGHDEIIDKTRKTQKPLTHEDLKSARKLADDKIRHSKPDPKIPIIITLIHGNRTPQEALEKHSATDKVKPKALQKAKERFMKEARTLAERPNGIPYVPFNDEMFDVIKDGGAYVLMNLGNGWKYHRLETKGCYNLAQAIMALKEAKIRSAWKESDLRKRTQKDLIGNKKKRAEARQKIVARIDRRFSKIHIATDPLQWPGGKRSWRGLLREVIKGANELSKAA